VLEVRTGAGAYVCGEETSLLNSLEGKRGEVRAKPPLPALEGLFGKPTVVNNVLTLAAVPWIWRTAARPMRRSALAGQGHDADPARRQRQIWRPVRNRLRHHAGRTGQRVGGGTASGRPVRAVQVGGPLGAYHPPADFHLPFDYESFAAADGLIGHAGLTVFDDSVDMSAQARFAMAFCAAESCGKCTPCRIGSTRGVEVIDRIRARARAPPTRWSAAADRTTPARARARWPRRSPCSKTCAKR
jgi:formate dehydrogenase iron-sulfur subunit